MNVKEVERKKEKEFEKRSFIFQILRFWERVKSVAYTYSDNFEYAGFFNVSKTLKVFLGGFILSFSSIGGVNPFGISFVSASGKMGRTERISAFLGTAVASLFIEKGIWFFLASFLAVVLGEIFSFKNRIRETEIAFSAFCGSLFFVFFGVKAFFIAAIGLPVFALAFCGLFHEKKQVDSVLADGGFLCLSLAVSLAFSEFSLWRLSFGIICALFFLVEGAERGGYYLGSLSGFFSGVALGTSYVVPLSVAGFICGIFIRRRRRAGILLTFASLLVFSFLSFGGKDVLKMIISSFWGIILWVSVSDLILDKKRVKLPISILRKKNVEEKKLSDALGNVSLALSSISKMKRREREEKTMLVLEGIFSEECETCTGCRLNVEAAKGRLCVNMLKNRKISSDNFSDEFKNGCSRFGIIEDKINALMEENPHKTSIRIDTLAEDYMAISRILALGEKRAENRYYHDATASKNIKLALEMKNIRVQRVEVTGTRLPEVELLGIPFKLPFPEKTIKKEIEKTLGKDMEISFLEAESKTAKMGFVAVCPLKIEYYKLSIPKKDELICGDSVSVFDGSDGYFYSLISDGMGSGRDAAVCSRLGTVFLEKLISAGIDKAGAVSMLGNVISASEDEIFTTVDLAEVDLVRGKISFLKAGAAPSWILRNGRAYSISSKTLPCGIIPKSPTEQTIVDCYSGDIVIMASDGGEWAEGALGTIGKMMEKKILDPKAIASFLVEEAAKKSGRSDDISFSVLSIL
ncbi:MAG: SpoIIE family protein phosphatase [Clostridia bacterium]|nr:SpoIIE family protein phosphatase [Clostridia bacterium]